MNTCLGFSEKPKGKDGFRSKVNMSTSIHDSNGRIILEQKDGVWVQYFYLTSSPHSERQVWILEDFIPSTDKHKIPLPSYPFSTPEDNKTRKYYIFAGTHKTPEYLRCDIIGGRRMRVRCISQDRVNLWISLKTGCFQTEGV